MDKSKDCKRLTELTHGFEKAYDALNALEDIGLCTDDLFEKLYEFERAELEPFLEKYLGFACWLTRDEPNPIDDFVEHHGLLESANLVLWMIKKPRLGAHLWYVKFDSDDIAYVIAPFFMIDWNKSLTGVSFITFIKSLTGEEVKNHEAV